MVSYAKLQQDSELHKQSIHQTKILRTTINLIENLVETKKFLIEKAKENAKIFNAIYERLTSTKVKPERKTQELEEEPEMEEAMTGEFTSLDLEAPKEIIKEDEE